MTAISSLCVAVVATACVCALTRGPLEIYCDALYVLYNGTSSLLCLCCHCRLLLFLREHTKRGQTPRQNAYPKPCSSYCSEEVHRGNGRIFQLVAKATRCRFSISRSLQDYSLRYTDFYLNKYLIVFLVIQITFGD